MDPANFLLAAPDTVIMIFITLRQAAILARATDNPLVFLLPSSQKHGRLPATFDFDESPARYA